MNVRNIRAFIDDAIGLPLTDTATQARAAVEDYRATARRYVTSRATRDELRAARASMDASLLQLLSSVEDYLGSGR